MRRRKRRKTWVAVALGFVVGALTGAGGYYLVEHLPAFGVFAAQVDLSGWLENARGASVPIVAVASGVEKFGVACTLAVKVEPGEGFVYVSIDPMLVGFDFQEADRKAIEVAAARAGLELDADGVGIEAHDIKFLVVGPGRQVQIEAIDGQSAGAATTLALLAAFENRQIKEGFVITGTIEEDGSIGPVGGIFHKAQAAHEIGATHFLVPEGQSVITVYKKVARRIGPWRFVSYVPEPLDLNQYSRDEGWGLEVIEVSNIEQAALLMLE
jgi:uncharacterized protein